MHAKKSIVKTFQSDTSNTSVKLKTIDIKRRSHIHIASYYYII